MLAFSRTSLCVFFSPKTNKTSHASKLGSRLQSVSLLAVLILSLAGWLSASPGPSGQWTLTAAMSQARTGHTATWLPAGSGGYVLVTGGTTTGGTVLDSAELYDPAANRWTLLPAP